MTRTTLGMALGFGVVALGALLSAGAAVGARGAERSLAIAAGDTSELSRTEARDRLQSLMASLHGAPLAAALGAAAALIGLLLAGPFAALFAACVGAAAPSLIGRRRDRQRGLMLERQLGDLAETVALAVRSGLSPVHAMDFASDESALPMKDLLQRMRAEQELGASFEVALEGLAGTIGTDEARLLVLVMGIQARSGGNLAVALEEVASTIRHRFAVRRELRALSAQGRISGAVLGTLPVGFFLILAATSHHELVPVYRSPAGIAMVGSGLIMQAIAYLWIRRLMKVEV